MICKECREQEKFGAVCGQGFTEWVCPKCGTKLIHHNTAVPKVCHACSEKFNICETCGREINDGN